MGWSGRAPAPPASEAGKGHQRQGARHVSDIQYRDRRDRHRYRQELVPRRGPRCARRHRAAAKVEARLANVPPCLIGMEACVGAHNLSRNLASLGHDARLMPAKYVRPYSKGQKNDFNDAEAIAEAVQRPTMKFVATKTAEQLDLQALHRVRERLVSQRTGIINQIRAFMLERGIAVRQGIGFLRTELPTILATRTDALSSRMLRVIEDLAGDWRRLDPRIDGLSGEIEALARQDQACSMPACFRFVFRWKLGWLAMPPKHCAPCSHGFARNLQEIGARPSNLTLGAGGRRWKTAPGNRL